MEKMRMVIKDNEGNTVMGAQIHFVYSRWKHNRHNEMVIATDSHVKEEIFFAEDKLPYQNPIVCDMNGVTPEILIPTPTNRG